MNKKSDSKGFRVMDRNQEYILSVLFNDDNIIKLLLKYGNRGLYSLIEDRSCTVQKVDIFSGGVVGSDDIVLIYVTLKDKKENKQYNIITLYDRNLCGSNKDKYINLLRSVNIQQGDVTVILLLDDTFYNVLAEGVLNDSAINLIEDFTFTGKVFVDRSEAVLNEDRILLSFFQIFRVVCGKALLCSLEIQDLPINKYESMKGLYFYEAKCSAKVTGFINDISLPTNTQIHCYEKNENSMFSQSLLAYARMARNTIKSSAIFEHDNKLIKIIESCLEVAENRSAVEESLMKILNK